MTIDVSVTVPTYREAENLPVLIPQIHEAFQIAGLQGEILVVDDDSQDGTTDVCARLAANYPVRLIVRRGERGLSGAVLCGLREAVGEVLVTMDADLSHPPEQISELVNALRSGSYDFVIGSRYTPGGSTDEDWGFLRWVNSKAATLLARGLTSARDPMSGFFALLRERFLLANELNPIGYKIGLELMIKCNCRRVGEIPIRFQNRRHGASKLNFREQLRYLQHIKRLYWYRLRGSAATQVPAE